MQERPHPHFFFFLPPLFAGLYAGCAPASWLEVAQSKPTEPNSQITEEPIEEEVEDVADIKKTISLDKKIQLELWYRPEKKQPPSKQEWLCLSQLRFVSALTLSPILQENSSEQEKKKSSYRASYLNSPHTELYLKIRELENNCNNFHAEKNPILSIKVMEQIEAKKENSLLLLSVFPVVGTEKNWIIPLNKKSIHFNLGILKILIQFKDGTEDEVKILF